MKHTKCFIWAAIATLVLPTSAAVAGTAVVEKAELQRSGKTWTVTVTLRHEDTGWDHYADGWGVYLPDGTELGYRVLAHPHVEEQPFTRTLRGVTIPEDATKVVIIAKDSVHGTGDAYEITLD